jgi:transposase
VHLHHHIPTIDFDADIFAALGLDPTTLPTGNEPETLRSEDIGRLSDAEWEVLAPHFRNGDRAFVDGALWIARRGPQWSILPEDFGSSDGVRKRMERWALTRMWEPIVESAERSGTLAPDRMQEFKRILQMAEEQRVRISEQREQRRRSL